MYEYTCPVTGRQVGGFASIEAAVSSSYMDDEFSWGGHGYAVVAASDVRVPRVGRV